MIRLRLLVIAAFLTLICSASVKAEPGRIRHVVMIVADDMGYADTGVTGAGDFRTPHLDSIATGGVRLTRAYVTAAVCSPSRAGFLTGRYQQRFGHENNGSGPPPFGLPLTERTMADHFKAAGFATGLVGKWHLGEVDGYHPLDRGFDEFVGHLRGGHGYFPESDRNARRGDVGKIQRGREVAQWDQYLTTFFGESSVDFIERHADEPFFLYLSFNAPHTPLEAREEDLARVAHIADESRRTYAAM
ncbi:MAG: sulfatase-like hydrolase/transferase, partial [Planctomycetota bacterium]